MFMTMNFKINGNKKEGTYTQFEASNRVPQQFQLVSPVSGQELRAQSHGQNAVTHVLYSIADSNLSQKTAQSILQVKCYKSTIERFITHSSCILINS